MNTKKMIAMMAAALIAAGNLAQAQMTGDLTGETLSGQTGIEVATGEAVLPKLVRAYAPGFSASELYAGPEEIKSKAVSQELLGRIVYSVAGVARGQGEMAGKIWMVIWGCFGAVAMIGGFLVFQKIGAGQAPTEDAYKFVLRFFLAFVLIKWCCGFVPNLMISSTDWLTSSLTPSSTKLDEVEEAFAAALISGVKGQTTANAAYAATQVSLAVPNGQAGNIKVDESALAAKYQAIFLNGFCRLGNSKYDDFDTFATAVVAAAKKGEHTERQGWAGVADVMNGLNPATAGLKLVFGDRNSKAWDTLSLDEKRARISQVISNCVVDASKAVTLAIREDLISAASGSELDKLRDNIGLWFDRATGMSIGELISGHQNIFRKLGNAFAAPSVDKSELESSYKWLTRALQFAAFELAVCIWLQPFALCASAFGLCFSTAHLRRVILGLVGLLVAAATVATLGQIALDVMIGRVSGAAKAIDTGSWLAAIGGLDIEMITYAILIVIAPPVVAASVVWGSSIAVSKLSSSLNSGGMSGPGTGGGWIDAAGRQMGVGGGASIWDQINGNKK